MARVSRFRRSIRAYIVGQRNNCVRNYYMGFGFISAGQSLARPSFLVIFVQRPPLLALIWPVVSKPPHLSQLCQCTDIFTTVAAY